MWTYQGDTKDIPIEIRIDTCVTLLICAENCPEVWTEPLGPDHGTRKDRYCAYHGKALPPDFLETLILQFGKPVSQTGTPDNGQFWWEGDGMDVSVARDEKQRFVDFKSPVR